MHILYSSFDLGSFYYRPCSYKIQEDGIWMAWLLKKDNLKKAVLSYDTRPGLSVNAVFCFL